MDNFLNIKTLHIRLTLRTTKLAPSELEQFLATLKPSKYLITLEEPDTKPHYHILLQSQFKDDKSNSKLRKLLNKLGFKGNGQMSISTVRSEQQLIKYILKDGQPIWKLNIPDTLIEQLKQISYQKGSSKFAQKLTTLEDQYLTKTLGKTLFIKSVLLLKSEFNHSININQLRSYFHKMHLRREPKYAEYLISQFFQN